MVCEPLALSAAVDRRETAELETSLFLRYRLFNSTYGIIPIRKFTHSANIAVGSDHLGVTAVSVP